MAKLIRQMNNLKIKRYGRNDPYSGYLVEAPDGRVLEDRLTLAQALDWARRTKDFVKVKTLSKGKPTLKDLNNALKAKGHKNKEATFHKGNFYVLHICRNDYPVPEFFSEDSKEVLDYIEGY